MATDSYIAAAQLVADFEIAVIDGTHKLATPANHFHIENLREKLLKALRADGPSLPGLKVASEHFARLEQEKFTRNDVIYELTVLIEDAAPCATSGSKE